MGSQKAIPRDPSLLLPWIPGLILLVGLLRMNGPAAAFSHRLLLGGFALWSGGVVILARAAAGREGGTVAAAAGGLAAAGLTVALALDPGRVPLQFSLWLGASAVALVGAALPWTRLARYPRLAGLAGLGFLALPMVAGVSTGGARAWVQWGSLRFQPGELARLLGILFLAGGLSGAPPGRMGPTDGPSRARYRHLTATVLAWLLLTGAWVMQRDLGGAFLSYLLLPAAWLLAGGGWRVAGGLLALGLGAAWALVAAFPHAAARVGVWLDPWSQASGGGYQLLQGLASLRLGGLWGEAGGMMGAAAVPAVATDLPLAALAQGAGALAVWGILYLEWLIVAGGLGAAARAGAPCARVLVGLAAVLWGLETLLPTAGWLGLVPLTGLPLPLVSRGGTAWLAHGVLLGWLLWGFRRVSGAERSG